MDYEADDTSHVRSSLRPCCVVSRPSRQQTCPAAAASQLITTDRSVEHGVGNIFHPTSVNTEQWQLWMQLDTKESE